MAPARDWEFSMRPPAGARRAESPMPHGVCPVGTPGEGVDVKRYLREELGVMRRVGGFDAAIALFIRDYGGATRVVAVYDASPGVRLREVLLDVARAIREEVGRDRPPPRGPRGLGTCTS